MKTMSPFVSKSQQKFMFAKHPKIAKEFAEETPNIKKLPEHKMRTETLQPMKKGQHKITFHAGGLHESTHTPAGKPISSKKMQEAESGKLGSKAKKQALFKQNVLTGPKHRKVHRGAIESDAGDMSHYDPNLGVGKTGIKNLFPQKQIVGPDNLSSVARKTKKRSVAEDVSEKKAYRGKKRGLSKKFGQKNPESPQLPEMDDNGNEIAQRKLGYSKVKVGSPSGARTSIPTPAERKLRERIEKKMGNVRSSFRI